MQHKKFIVSCILSIMFWTSLFASQPSVFQSALSKQGWYSADPVLLHNELQQLLETASSNEVSNPIAMIMPHAGYAYCGPIMANAIKSVSGHHVDRIIIIGPSHYHSLPNQAAVLVTDTIQTPLGTLSVDKEAVSYLLNKSGIVNKPEIHPKEHSVQIELPWIQVAFPNTPVVPIVLGQLDRESLMHFADILRPLLTPETLLIISSDFTHFGKNFNYVPFTENIPENIQRLDATALYYINNKDLIGFQHFIRNTQATICGEMPIQLLLELLPTNAVSHHAGYYASGQLNGDWSHSVSYASVVFSGQWKNEAFDLTYPQSEVEGKKLIAYARRCMELYLKNGTLNEEKLKLEPVFKQKLSAFVTLKKYGQLRGCIGSIYPSQLLVDEIKTQAINAAINDRRFQPVTFSELKQCEIEISILSPIKPCESYKDIRLGKHGIILKKGESQAVFLPQVAGEQGWDLKETLTALSQKAGLPGDAWKTDAEFNVFVATVFSEK